ncbi:MAG: hypothetical protein II938_01785 [Alphaproteobacteria bacterium]|nr:hypothetical protein [Alphaproteobacteria bacterium]
MKKFALILSVFLLAACSQFAPFEDMRREAGQIPTVGQSSNNRPAICYNPLWHDQEQLQVLADQACARTGRKAIFQDSNAFACRLINPSVAIYTCE